MNLNRHLLKILLVCSGLLAANSLLQFQIDHDLGIDWPHNVLRNWDQFGLFALKGRLVTNPGGYDSLLQPQVYPGHRGASLYPAFFIGRLFSWTGSHAMPFHILCTLLVLGAIAFLLGSDQRALFLGAISILCPGFLIWPTILDPNTNSVLAGFPYVAWLYWRLRQPRLTLLDLILILLFTLLFSLMNWTTALVHAQFFVFLATSRTVPWRRLALYACVGGLSALVIAITGFIAKFSNATQGGTPFLQLLAGYSWGSGGYSDGQPAIVLLRRLAFINALGLFPFWIACGWFWIRLARRQFSQALAALAPLLVSLAEVLALRNYFCHHPWMAAPVFLLGATLALTLVLQARPAATPEPAPFPASSQPAVLAAVLAIVFCFSFVVVLFYHQNQSRLISLVSLVRSGTARSDVIAVASDPNLPADDAVKRWPDLLDRHLIAWTEPGLGAPPVAARFLLSSSPVDIGAPLVARSETAEPRSRGLMDRCLDWFSTHIARRKHGDRPDLAATYYLYRLPGPALAPHSAEKISATLQTSP